MNVKRKSKLDVVIRILLIALVAVLVVFAVKVVFSAAKTAPVAADAAANEDKSVIGEFQAGTYGGIKMDTAEDAVKYYVEAYNKTKAETAEFNTPDGKQTWSAFIGDEDLKINSVIIDGGTRYRRRHFSLRHLCPASHRRQSAEGRCRREGQQLSHLFSDCR